MRWRASSDLVETRCEKSRNDGAQTGKAQNEDEADLTG